MNCKDSTSFSEYIALKNGGTNVPQTLFTISVDDQNLQIELMENDKTTFRSFDGKAYFRLDHIAIIDENGEMIGHVGYKYIDRETWNGMSNKEKKDMEFLGGEDIVDKPHIDYIRVCENKRRKNLAETMIISAASVLAKKGMTLYSSTHANQQFAAREVWNDLLEKYPDKIRKVIWKRDERDKNFRWEFDMRQEN